LRAWVSGLFGQFSDLLGRGRRRGRPGRLDAFSLPAWNSAGCRDKPGDVKQMMQKPTATCS